MKQAEALRLIAGVLVGISIILAVTVNINWLWFTGFAALNQIQSAFTRWCPMVWLLDKVGIER